VGRAAVISGLTGLHQFVRVGAGAFVGGGLRLDRDVPPGIKALGDPVRWGGLNPLGWERLGLDSVHLKVIENFYRTLSHQGAAHWVAALAEIPDEASLAKSLLTEFFQLHRRGLVLRGN